MKTKLQLKDFNSYATDATTTYTAKSDDIVVQILGPGLKELSRYCVSITVYKDNNYPIRLINSSKMSHIEIGLNNKIIMYSKQFDTARQAINFTNKVLF